MKAKIINKLLERYTYIRLYNTTIPLGDHLTHVAALLILKSTRVGFHLPLSSIVQTYAFRSYYINNKVCNFILIHTCLREVRLENYT